MHKLYSKLNFLFKLLPLTLYLVLKSFYFLSALNKAKHVLPYSLIEINLHARAISESDTNIL